MKKLFILLLFVSSLGFSQSSGITYQAVIYNPNGEELPGVDNPYAPLTNQDVCLQFGIVDADGNVEYQEEVQVTTDAFGMVNLLIGTNTQTGGYATDFAGIEWSADAKFLKVDLDIRGSCTDFEELSNQPFTYVPFAYYSPASDTPGPEGPQGQDGNDGQDGATGPAGPAGSTGQAGPAGPNGQDGSTGPAGPTGPSGPQGEQGPAGADGENGNDGEGLNSLISSATEEAGENCSNGGVKILTGIDTNNNGTLDEDEVDQDNTQYICNGSNGEGGSGIGNFTGEDLVPEEIIIMSNDGVIVTSYTIPNGKYAKISAILGNAAGSASQLYPGFQDLKLDVNGVETYIGGSGVAPLSGGNGNDEQMFSDALYFPSNTVLEIGEYGATVFLEVYSLNNFIPKIITSEDIVPEGKKWKVCNILASESLIRSSASPYSHGPGNEVFINNTSIMANGGNTSQNGGGAGFDVVSFANSSFWIPEGTTLAPGANTYAVIILEFDSSLSSGSGSGGSGSGGSGSPIECTTGGGLDYGDDYIAGPTLTDNDGNTYETVEICGQTWTTSNLNVSTYKDGTPIPHITDYNEWYNATTGAYTYALQDGTLGWGKLYNSYAILGVDDDDPNTPNKELSPEGYHIPSSLEWNQLFLIYNDSNTAHSYLRSETSWTLNGNNESGLNIIRASTVNSLWNPTNTGKGFYTLTETELPNCQGNLYEYTVFASRTINGNGVQGVTMNGCNMFAEVLDYSGANHAQSSGYLGAYIRLLKD